jgi:hypothetical protein
MTGRVKVISTTPKVLISRRTPGSFKVCPLCGTLNVKENEECCCCSWKGAFETSPEKVQVVMWQMVDASSELQMLLLRELRRPWWKGFSAWLKGVFRRRLDVRA